MNAGPEVRLLAALLLALAATGAPAQDLATLGTARVTAEEIKHLLALEPEPRQHLASEAALEVLVQRELIRRALLDQALAQAWEKRPDIAERAQLAREQMIVTTWLDSFARLPEDYPPESEMKAFYEENRAHLRVPRRYHLAQIFIRRPATPAAASEAHSRANALAKRAEAPGAEFGALARTESEEDAGRTAGGDIGWIPESNLLPELRATVQSLKPGAIAGPVETRNGWHILRLVELREPGPASLEEARASITRLLRQRKVAQLREAHIDEMLKKTPPNFDRERLSKLNAELK